MELSLIMKKKLPLTKVLTSAVYCAGFVWKNADTDSPKLVKYTSKQKLKKYLIPRRRAKYTLCINVCLWPSSRSVLTKGSRKKNKLRGGGVGRG